MGSSASSLKQVNIGLPQGSILGPTLFLCFINDLPSHVKNLHTTLFADDTTLSIACSSYLDLVPQLNEELVEVQKWIENNRLTVNIDKTELMVVSNKNININDSQIIFQNNFLKFSDCSMFLGLKLDNRLKFSDHINLISSKLSKNIGLFSKIRHNLPLTARLNYYNGLIFPYISQNIIIWGKTYDCYTQPLFILQKRMIRLISNADFLEHTNPLFFRLKILKLEDIYRYFMCIHMHKCIENGEFRPTHSINTRNRDRAQPVFQRLTSGQQSVAFMGPKTWNSLPDNIRSITNINTFKLKLKTYLINQYDTHDLNDWD